MPIYDYHCQSCGEFTLIRPVAEASFEQVCPDCGSAAMRVIKAPNLAVMDASNRTRWERNEKASETPTKVRRSSCGCSGGQHTCGSKSSSSAKDTAKPGLKMQTKKTARPWMLGH